MASKTRHGDRHRKRRPAARSGQPGPDPASRSTDDRGTSIWQDENRSPQGPQSIPDDGGTESDRGSVVRQDRNFDSGPAPKQSPK